MIKTIKLIVESKTPSGKIQKLKYPVKVIEAHGRLFFKFDYNPTLMAEIKSMQGAKYHDYDDTGTKVWLRQVFGTSKIWSIAQCPRNEFQLKCLQGENPYEWYDRPLIPVTANRSELRAHQLEFKSFGMTYKRCIIAGEMGVGKSLFSAEVMESSGLANWWYVAPRGVLKEINKQIRDWKWGVIPKLMTYEGLVKEMENWIAGTPAPQGVIFDESSRIKNPTAQRSRAAMALADGIRHDHGDEGYIILMSGSPAPKAPSDWWHQAEVACPGFLKEGDVTKCQKRLALFEPQETIQGSKFLKLITWLDDENKCAICGQLAGHMNHSDMGISGDDHIFKSSVNEVAKLYKRMNGIVHVKFKKDCVDLPDKIYRVVELQPTVSIRRAASSIANRTKSAAQALILLRELSDGFQYQETPDGTMTCEWCNGTKQLYDWEIKPEFQQSYDDGSLCLDDAPQEKHFQQSLMPCYHCDGTGEVTKYVRTVAEVQCPKDDAFRDILDEHFDDGRLVVYAGFQGSIDRCVRIAKAEGWEVIRVDGRGWQMFNYDGTSMVGDALDIFQKGHETHPHVCFIGHPGSAGMGLTLTASKSIMYFSSDFSAENRLQSEDRIHRIGMDLNKGATIIDLLHLPTDRLVLENLKKKRVLQAITMGQLQAAIMEPTEQRLV